MGDAAPAVAGEPMTVPRPALFAAGSALALLLVALPASAISQPTGWCFQPTRGERVCYHFDHGACVWSTQFGQVTDFGTIQLVCATTEQDAYGRDACAETIAGFGTLSGFYGLDQRSCVYVFQWSGDLCVVAWGDAQGIASWQTDQPVCVPTEWQTSA